MTSARQLSGIFRTGKLLTQRKVCAAPWFCRSVLTKKKQKPPSGCFRNTLLWLHTVFAVLYLILTVFLLKRHTSQIKARPTETVSHRLCKDYKRLSGALYVRRLSRLLSQRSLIGRLRLIASDWPFVCLWRTCFSGLQTRNTLLVCSVPKTATEEAIATHFMWAKMSKFTLAGFFFFCQSSLVLSCS